MLTTVSRGLYAASRGGARGLAARSEAGQPPKATSAAGAAGAAKATKTRKAATAAKKKVSGTPKGAAAPGRKLAAAAPGRKLAAAAAAAAAPTRASGNSRSPLNASPATLAPASSSVFVSEHFRLAAGEVEAYLDRHGVAFRKAAGELVVETCPFCHDTKRKRDNLYKLYVDAASGVYFCHRCAAKGSWFALRQHVGGDPHGRPVSSFASLASASVKRPRGKSNTAKLPAPAAKLDEAKPLPRPPAAKWRSLQENLKIKFPTVRERLNRVRGIKTEVLERYGVGADRFPFYSGGGQREELTSYAFPMFNSKKELVRFKIRAVDSKAHMKVDPQGGEWGMFGLNTVPDDAKEVVITEGEFDAMAVYQATGYPAISLPNGARSLPVSLLPGLERFEKIYLWMDDDIPGQEGAQQFSRKLGVQRCHLVRCGSAAVSCKDANDALLQGLDLSALLKQSLPLPHEGVATFADLRDEIYTEFTNPLQVQGVQSEFLPRLNSLLKGHRRGELSIISGHTGVGKTTLLSQMSLDYCMQGVPTLWGSFEITNVRIAKLLLSQFYARSTGKSPVGLVHDFDEWAEKFSALPLYFMRYFGSNPIERVLDAMEYANYVHDCSHVLLDNLQFMTSGQGRGYDRFEVMDAAVGKLRHFSSAHNAHVSLVVHPRKENDDQAIQTASVFGTAKATQEADNLLILQRTQSGPVLDVRKNRFDGTLGTMNLRFNESSRMFEERDAPRRETRTLSSSRQGQKQGLGNLASNRVTYMGVKSRVAL